MKKLIIIILLLLCLTANVSHSQSFKMFGQLPSGQFADGLVFYWRGIEAVEVVDESRYGNHGTITGATWVGEGLNFLNDDFVTMPTHDFGSSNELTIVTRLFVAGTAVANDRICARGQFVYPFKLELTTVQAGQHKLTYTIRTAGGTNIIASPNFISKGDFIHVVIVYRTGWQALYLNGVINGTDTPTGTLNWNGVQSFGIGSNYNNSDNFFDGDITLFAIYNRALSAAEIQALYINPNLPMQQDPIWLLQPSVVPSGIIPIIQAHARRRRAG